MNRNLILSDRLEKEVGREGSYLNKIIENIPEKLLLNNGYLNIKYFKV